MFDLYLVDFFINQFTNSTNTASGALQVKIEKKKNLMKHNMMEIKHNKKINNKSYDP